LFFQTIYVFGFGVPLFIDVDQGTGGKWSLWFLHKLVLTGVYGLIVFMHHSRWRDRLPGYFLQGPVFYHVFFNIFVPCIMIHDCHLFVAAKPAYYNYICAMLLLNGLSLFGCLLVASGAGFGLWYVKNIIFKIYANLFPCKKSV
jgi:hypothetical protein